LPKRRAGGHKNAGSCAPDGVDSGVFFRLSSAPHEHENPTKEIRAFGRNSWLYSTLMNVQVAVLCDAATDTHGKLNLLGAFDAIFTPQLPLIHAMCSVALRATFSSQEEGARHLRLNFVDADGQPFMPPIDLPIRVALPEEAHFVTQNLIFTIQQLRFEKPGLYSIDISLDGRQEASIPLLIKYSPPKT